MCGRVVVADWLFVEPNQESDDPFPLEDDLDPHPLEDSDFDGVDDFDPQPLEDDFDPDEDGLEEDFDPKEDGPLASAMPAIRIAAATTDRRNRFMLFPLHIHF